MKMNRKTNAVEPGMSEDCVNHLCVDTIYDSLELFETREGSEYFEQINVSEFIDAEECSTLSDFVSAFSVDLIQETFHTAGTDGPSESSLDNLDSEQLDPFLVDRKVQSVNISNYKAEKTVLTTKHSEIKENGSTKSRYELSLLQCMIIFLVMLFTLSITLVIVCSQVTLPGRINRAQARPLMLSKDQVAILPNGNMVKMVGAKFMAPATQSQIVEYNNKVGQQSNSDI